MTDVDDLAEGTVIDEVSLKGINRPINIYELRSSTDG